MLPTTPELEKLIGELGIDEDSHVVVVPAGVQRARFRLGRAHLLDAESMPASAMSRSSTAASPPGRRRAMPLETGAQRAVADDLHRHARQKPARATPPRSRRSSSRGGATLVDARPASFFVGKEKAPAAKAYGHIPGALNLDSATFYDPATNRLKPKAELAAIAGAAAGRPGGQPIATPATGRRPTGSCCTNCSAASDVQALCRLDGRMDQQCQPPG